MSDVLQRSADHIHIAPRDVRGVHFTVARRRVPPRALLTCACAHGRSARAPARGALGGACTPAHPECAWSSRARRLRLGRACAASVHAACLRFSRACAPCPRGRPLAAEARYDSAVMSRRCSSLPPRRSRLRALAQPRRCAGAFGAWCPSGARAAGLLIPATLLSRRCQLLALLHSAN
jgi:hypothetical protein